MASWPTSMTSGLKIFKAPEKGLLIHLDVLLEVRINGYQINECVITYFYMVCILGS